MPIHNLRTNILEAILLTAVIVGLIGLLALLP